MRSNVIEVVNTLPYRVGDSVQAKGGSLTATIQSIQDQAYLFLSSELEANTAFGQPIYIVNNEADTES